MRRTAEWLENPRNLWRAVRIRWRLRYVSLLVAYLMGVLQGADQWAHPVEPRRGAARGREIGKLVKYGPDTHDDTDAVTYRTE